MRRRLSSTCTTLCSAETEGEQGKKEGLNYPNCPGCATYKHTHLVNPVHKHYFLVLPIIHHKGVVIILPYRSQETAIGREGQLNDASAMVAAAMEHPPRSRRGGRTHHNVSATMGYQFKPSGHAYLNTTSLLMYLLSPSGLHTMIFGRRPTSPVATNLPLCRAQHGLGVAGYLGRSA